MSIILSNKTTEVRAATVDIPIVRTVELPDLKDIFKRKAEYAMTIYEDIFAGLLADVEGDIDLNVTRFKFASSNLRYSVGKPIVDLNYTRPIQTLEIEELDTSFKKMPNLMLALKSAKGRKISVEAKDKRIFAVYTGSDARTDDDTTVGYAMDMEFTQRSNIIEVRMFLHLRVMSHAVNKNADGDKACETWAEAIVKEGKF